MSSDDVAVEEAVRRAVGYFNGGWNCAEAVATAVAETVRHPVAIFPRVATCFGGGLGRRGETCGAVVGALLAAGFAAGRLPGEGDEAKRRCYRLAEEIVEFFRKRFGTLLCRELLGVDLATDEGKRAFTEMDLHNTRCTTFIAEMTRVALAVLGDYKAQEY